MLPHIIRRVGKTPAEDVFDEGMRRFEAGDLEHAAQAFERALALDPRFARALYQLGNVRQDQERWAEAEGCFRASLALAPGHAEAHNNLGVVLQMLGRRREAEASYALAAALKPALVHPYMNLGRMLDETGRRAEAIAWLRRGSAQSAEPEAFRHLLGALGAEADADAGRAPDAYVRNTFDGFAAHFDHRLVETLGYRVPQAIAAALAEARAFPPASADVLDLGCGTGLSGVALRGIAKSLTGVDLAPKMLEHARARGCYDVLEEGELLRWMESSAAARFDVLVAVDVLIYVGALEHLFAQAARISRSGALFALSIEVCQDADWKLQETGRYAQSPAYVRGLAAANGFTVAVDRAQPIRKPVVGWLFVLVRD
jgi:predicted TPR repeat methyltransferase